MHSRYKGQIYTNCSIQALTRSLRFESGPALYIREVSTRAVCLVEQLWISTLSEVAPTHGLSAVIVLSTVGGMYHYSCRVCSTVLGRHLWKAAQVTCLT